MVEEVDRRLAAQAELDPTAGVSEPDVPQWQYLSFLAGLGHDLGKLFDMDLRAGDQRWSPLHETHAEFLRHVKVEPVFRWDEDRVRGGHAQLSPWLMHHLLTPADIRFIGVERLPQLAVAVTGTHAGDQSTPMARLVSKLDQESVEQAAPEWLNKRLDSKVNEFIRALRTVISDGGLSVNTPGAPVYVTGDEAAIVVPRAIGAVRHYLKEEKIRLPNNHCLYDLLAQAGVVLADGDRQCVKRIRVPGKHGPVELSAVIFNRETIIPQPILPTLPKVTFEVVPGEPKPVAEVANSDESNRPRQRNLLADHNQVASTNGNGSNHKRHWAHPACGGLTPAAGGSWRDLGSVLNLRSTLPRFPKAGEQDTIRDNQERSVCP
jgi:hypothetical protein